MSTEKMFEVDKDWIDFNRTVKGAFTRKQIQALHIEWPPVKGWINEICGSMITFEQKKQFEMASSCYAKGKVKDHLSLAVSLVLDSVSKLTDEQKAQLIEAIK